MDINEGVLQLGAEKAARDGVSLKAVVQYANFLKLTELYDVVLAHAALHHFINLEHIFQEIHDHLAPDGVFIAHEHVPRNGMLMWPETNELVNRVFAALPPRYRRLKTHQGIHIQQEYPEVDCSQDGFECVRSQDIVPLLEKMFRVEAKVLGHSFARRFVDGALGENYDLTR